MPPSAAADSPVTLVCGEDDFLVKRRSRQLFEQWAGGAGDFDREIIDGGAANSGEALRSISRLRESIQTLPFFGQGKTVWWQNCSFLGEDRTSTSTAVTDALADLADEIKSFAWGKVRLLISAGKVDKRRVFYKAIEKIGRTELLDGWSLEDRDWASQAEAWADRELAEIGRSITPAALAALVTAAGPNPRLLRAEIDKLDLYAEAGRPIEESDIEAVVARQKQAEAFALAEAVGDRDLARALRHLDSELSDLARDSQKSAIGILYGLITKIRVLLFLREAVRIGWIKTDTDYQRFKSQLTRLPAAGLPSDKRWNPLLQHPFVLFKALPQLGRYQTPELIRIMDRLLDANRKLVGSGLPEELVLRQLVVQIIRPSAS